MRRARGVRRERRDEDDDCEELDGHYHAVVNHEAAVGALDDLRQAVVDVLLRKLYAEVAAQARC
jgi:hypothetical protein